MIFPVLETEDIVQVGDQTRLNAGKSIATKDEEQISKVEIEPEGGSGFIDVTDQSPRDWFLDWFYTGITRTVTASVRITIGVTVTTKTKTISVISAADDKLFSADTDLIALEPEILKYVVDGRSSFLNVHRLAQTKILESLDESGVVDTAGAKLTKAAVVDVSEVKAWSRDLTLHLIFKGLIVSVDDVFMVRSKYYWGEVQSRMARAILRLDLNGDGQLEKSEGVTFGSMNLVRT